MSPSQIKKRNTFIGAIFIPLGILAWSGAVYMVVKPNTPISLTTSKVSVLKPDCDNVLRSQGLSNFSFDAKSKEYSYKASLSPDAPKSQFYSASLAISECKGTLKYFCAGDGCKGDQFQVTFSAPIK